MTICLKACIIIPSIGINITIKNLKLSFMQMKWYNFQILFIFKIFIVS